MAIGRIERINSTTPSTAVSSVNNTSRTLQNQLLMKQQNLKKLSSDSNLSVDEKEKQQQELQKEIEELKRKLEQMRLKQEETEKAEETKQKKEIDLEKTSETEEEKEENNASAVKESEEHKQERIELSADEVKKMMDMNLFIKEEMVQQGAEYDQQNHVRVLSAEIKQDEIHGLDTTSKEEDLKELQRKENFWVEAQNKDAKQKAPSIISPDIQVVIE